jgi:hypothetical protein
VLAVSAEKFRNTWERFAALHQGELLQGEEDCLPLLAAKGSLSATKAAGRGGGFDVLCREIVGACHWNTMQAGTDFFDANAHIVAKIQKNRPGATKPTVHVRLLPRLQG